MNIFTTTIYPHHRIGQEEPLSHKIMLRLDRQFRRRHIRSYRGWQVSNLRDAQLNFDDGVVIRISQLGNMRRIKSS